MILRKWEDLPERMKNDAVKPYYDYLCTKRFHLCIKRMFDIFASFVLIVLLSPVMLAVSIAIVVKSGRPVLFRQKRITQYGKEYRIFKFRTMINDADKKGPLVTAQEDARITSVGRKLRNRRLDEFPQLFNIFSGDMSFVGTRPEVQKYVECYDAEMMSTLLLPAGLTSLASITFKDEDALLSLSKEKSRDMAYISQVLPKKMELNLKELQRFSIQRDFVTILRTLQTVLISSPKTGNS